MYNDDDKELNNAAYEDYEEEQDDGNEEEDSSDDSGQADFGGKGNFFKGASNFLGKAGKAIKNVAKVINKLPFPVKAFIFTLLVGLITYLIIDVMETEASDQTNNSINTTVSQMQSQVDSGVIKNEDGTETKLSEEEKEKLQKAIDFFKSNNSYLYFTIANVKYAYSNFVKEYENSTNDVGSKLYKSYTTEYGSDTLSEDALNNRIVNPNQKVPLFIHLLMTEKYNFNAIEWKWYGHGHNGEELPNEQMEFDTELGIKYPKVSKKELNDLLVSLSPYMLTWHIPMGFHSGFITKSGSDKQASAFTYSIIKNACSQIVAHRYDIQKYTLETKFNEYIESEYRSQFKVEVTVSYKYEPVMVIENSVLRSNYTEKLHGGIDALNKNNSNTSSEKLVQKKDENGNPLYTKSIKYEYSAVSPSDPIFEGEQEVNERLNSNGEVDPNLEEEVNKFTNITTNYYIKDAKTFDVKIANEFNYIKYNESDAINRKNPKLEQEYNLEDYEVIVNEEYKITDKNVGSQVIGKSMSEIANGYSISKGGFSEYQIVESYKPGTWHTMDGETTTSSSSSRTYEITCTSKNTYIEKIGKSEDGKGTHYIRRIWEDTLTQKSSKTTEYTEDDLVDFNANYNAELNGTNVSDEKTKYESLVKKSQHSYSQYKALAAEKLLSTIYMVNSNSNMYKEYLLSNSPQSKIMGYNKSYIEFALDEVKRLFKETENEKGTIPYIYGISLGFTNVLSGDNSYKVNSSSGLFGWPVDPEVNPYISAIYGYSDFYGKDFHGGIDIWASYPDENDMNHAWDNPSVPVYAAAGGKIIVASDIGAPNGDRVSTSANGGCGNYIVIKHDNGYITVYMHLSTQTFNVSLGDTVQKGDQLALIGSSGNSNCMHLHFSIYDNSDGDDSYTGNDRLDPLQFYKVENTEINDIPYDQLLSDESLRSQISKANMYKYVGSIGSGDVLPEGTPLPDLTDEEKQELSEQLKGTKLYDKIEDKKRLWLFQYYSQNPIEILARLMYAELVVNDVSSECGVYAIVAQTKALWNYVDGNVDNMIDNVLKNGNYIAYTTFVSGNFLSENIPQFYRQIAAAVINGDALPNPPGFLGTEKYWIGDSDGIKSDGTSNHFAYNDKNKQTCGFKSSLKSSSFHVFLTDEKNSDCIDLLVNNGIGNKFGINSKYEIENGIYVNSSAGGSSERNYNKIIEVLNKY